MTPRYRFLDVEFERANSWKWIVRALLVGLLAMAATIGFVVFKSNDKGNDKGNDSGDPGIPFIAAAVVLWGIVLLFLVMPCCVQAFWTTFKLRPTALDSARTWRWSTWDIFLRTNTEPDQDFILKYVTHMQETNAH